jgi:hypothetical protein
LSTVLYPNLVPKSLFPNSIIRDHSWHGLVAKLAPTQCYHIIFSIHPLQHCSHGSETVKFWHSFIFSLLTRSSYWKLALVCSVLLQVFMSWQSSIALESKMDKLCRYSLLLGAAHYSSWQWLKQSIFSYIALMMNGLSLSIQTILASKSTSLVRSLNIWELLHIPIFKRPRVVYALLSLSQPISSLLLRYDNCARLLVCLISLLSYAIRTI